MISKERKHGFSITNWRLYNKLLCLEKITMLNQDKLDAIKVLMDQVKTDIGALVSALQYQIDSENFRTDDVKSSEDTNTND